jgi:hypothetical protein
MARKSNDVRLQMNKPYRAMTTRKALGQFRIAYFLNLTAVTQRLQLMATPPLYYLLLRMYMLQVP